MTPFTIAVALIALVAVASAYDPCQKAYNQCDFRFEHDGYRVPTYDIWTQPDMAFTKRVISKDPHEKLGVLNSNHVVPEFINHDGSIVPITKEGHPKFTPTHFKPYSLKYTDGSGVGHQTFTGKQQHVAAGRCIRVFFTSYQLLTGHYPSVVKDNVHVNKHDYKCVVFRTL